MTNCILGAGLAAALCLGGAPVAAKELAYVASLKGRDAATSGDSGEAQIVVDSQARTVSVRITVHHITLEQLADNLVIASIGPIHFHLYPAHDHSSSANVTLLLPVSYGPNYAASADGFTVRMERYPYAQGAAALQSNQTFEQFVAAMDSGSVELNVHTDAYPQGQINGFITPAPAPTKARQRMRRRV